MQKSWYNAENTLVSLALSPPVSTRFIVRNRGRLEQGCRAAENNALGNKLRLVLV